MSEQQRCTSTIWALLAQVRIGERRRHSINASTVEQYRLWLEQGRDAPPVILICRGGVYVVRDGRHRVAAALAAGHAGIEAEVRAIVRFTILASRLAPWLERRPAVARALPASVVSTASMRPLYGRGAGSTPAGGF